MSCFKTIRAAALAGVCLTPAMILAQDDTQNEVSVGTRYQSQTSPVFGRYNGQTDKGFSSTGDVSLKGGDAWNSGGTDYYGLTGTDLGYQAGGKLGPEASVDFRYGQRGTWGVDVYYNAISYAGNTIYSPYLSTGILAAGSASLVNLGSNVGLTSNTAALRSQLVQQDTGLRRDIVGGTASYSFSNWTFSAEGRHEHKEGTLEGAAWNASFGSGESMPFVNPVNYDTDKYVAKMAYSAYGLQGQLSLTYSKFTDNNTGIALQQAPVAGIANPSTVYSAPPSNDAFYVNGSLGYLLGQDTHLLGNFRYGIEMQDASLAPVAGPGGLTAASVAALALNPQSSSALARVYGANVAADSTLFPHFDLHLGYMLDGRAVDTNPWVGIYGSATSSPPQTVSGAKVYAYSFPQEWSKQKINVEGNYRLLSNTKLTVGYTFNDIDRSMSQVDHSTESVVNARLATAIPSWQLDGSVAYSHGDRSAVMSLASINVPWTFTGSLPANPSVVFYQAPRLQDNVNLRANYHGLDDIDIGVIGRYTENRYTAPAGIVGTNNDRNAAIGPDVGWSPKPDMSYHLFYTYEQVYYDNRGAGAPYAANGYGYTAATTDTIHTVGVAADWKVNDKLKVGLDYTYYYGDIGYYLWGGAGTSSTAATTYQWQNVQNLPNVSSSMHNLTLHGQYEVTRNIGVWLGYQYQIFKDEDWAYNQWGAITKVSATNTAILTGVAQPSDHVNVIMTKLMVKF